MVGKTQFKPQHFLVNVAIIEGRHFSWPNMDSAVLVRVANQKKCTKIQRKSDSPFFNEYFVFEFFCTLETLMDKNITFTVIQPRQVCKAKKILGFTSLDIGTVYEEPNHQFYHKWAIISAPARDPTGGPRGYLKVDIGIVARGHTQKIPAGDVLAHDDIEGNLLLPVGASIDRQRANFVFEVYKGEGLGKLKGFSWCGDTKVHFEKNRPSPFVQISFVGLKGKTSVQKHTSNPVWNEKIILSELFPPLCQRVKIELFFNECCTDVPYAHHHISLHSISNENEQGFLPTFGPSYIYFYNNDVYIGKILLGMNTELQDKSFTVKKTVMVESLPPLNENFTSNSDPVFLFAAILEACAIPKKFNKKSISFQISFGSEIETDPKAVNSSFCIRTRPKTPSTHEEHVCSLPFQNDKPCLFLSNNFPDLKRRMFNSNMISKIALKMKNSLKDIEAILVNENWQTSFEELTNRLEDLLDTLSSGCQKYIDITKASTFLLANDLDNHRLHLCIKEMEDIMSVAKDLYDNKSKKKTFEKCQKLLKRIEYFIEDPQHCWPDIIISMLNGTKRISSYRIPAREIAYSVVEEEAGRHCGTVQDIFFELPHPKDEIVRNSLVICKMRVYLWAGITRHKSTCFENLPPGFQASIEGGRIEGISTKFSKRFSCRAHIFQGRIMPGLDDTGFADTFIRVVVLDQAMQTEVKRKSLNPIWDQTLLFHGLEAFGSAEYIKMYPPTIMFELYDRDSWHKVEYIGRAVADPLIKFATEPYSPPKFPPTLRWISLKNDDEETAEILATVELLEHSGVNDDILLPNEIKQIPSDIRPNLQTYRLEVLFWGVRDLKKVHLLSIKKPKITVELANEILHSETIPNTKERLNFLTPIKFMDVELPEQEAYLPQLCLKMYDSRSFGRYTFCGINTSPVQQFVYHCLTLTERNEILINKPTECDTSSWDSKFMILSADTGATGDGITEETAKLIESDSDVQERRQERDVKQKDGKLIRTNLASKNRKKSRTQVVNEEVDEDNMDWWTKYHNSIEEVESIEVSSNTSHIIKIYTEELEAQQEFGNFNDCFRSFPFYRGKRTGDETVDEENITGTFKGAIRLYPWPPKSDECLTIYGSNIKNGVFQDHALNESLPFVVRIYCIKGVSLRPKDASGKSDSYICITMNDKQVRDRDGYIPKQVNPIYGRCFELRGIFPDDHSINIALWDWDATSADDLIGETMIDIENRFYSRHRAICGLASKYEEQGFAVWRDQERPKAILERLCRRYKLPTPIYLANSVVIGTKEFSMKHFLSSDDQDFDREVLSLNALRRWHEYPLVGFHLVPEHIETRSLYHPSKPGIEQGKLQMWIDIFPIKELPTPPQVDITPRKPVPYELRVIIWNADDVTMQEDDFFLGEKKSDIFVKGWVIDPELAQCTDVHYRSISGEGNFNWRFVFVFEYLAAENRIVIRKKESFFSSEETEIKIPCRLTLQIWENDCVSRDDFLGTVILELARLPKPAKSSKTCTLKNLTPDVPTINLFKTKRTKGWWPVKNVNEDTPYLAGKLEIEMEVLTAEEAEKEPVGLGRSEPNALPKPNRPDVSFSCIKNPFKACKYVICKRHRCKFIIIISVILLILMGVLGVYAFPGYTVKKLLGA